MLDIIAFWVRLGLFFVGGTENNLVIYGKKLRKLPRVFYLPNSDCTLFSFSLIFANGLIHNIANRKPASTCTQYVR